MRRLGLRRAAQPQRAQPPAVRRRRLGRVLRAWTELLEAVDRFEPEAIFLSAGFDAHADEELASINLADDDYDWITRQAVALAGDRPLVSVLEGGYGLDVLARCTRVHLAALLDG